MYALALRFFILSGKKHFNVLSIYFSYSPFISFSSFLSILSPSLNKDFTYLLTYLLTYEVLVNHLGGLGLPSKSVVRLTDRPDITLDFNVDVKQQHNNNQMFFE